MVEEKPEILEKRRALLEKNNKAIMELKRTGTCSVCSLKAKKNNLLFRSNLTGKSVCTKCLHQLNMSGDEPRIPKGAIQCQKCKSIDAQVFHYHNRLKAVFSYSGLSQDGTSIYGITHTTGLWKKGSKPRNVTCGHCGLSIPDWMWEMNRYVRFAHTP